ncbi:MAG: sulfite exporter TauE/SafE family protein [Hyphomicrobiaceae bacterium]
MEAGTLAALTIATGLGAAVQAATGFGFAIVAAPVFLWAFDSTAAIPILVALHVVQSALLVPRVWHAADGWHLSRLVAGATVGCPVGLWLLTGADTRQLKLGVGVTILAVLGMLLWRQRRYADPGENAACPGASTASTMTAGCAAGALTALLVMPGPPLMVHFLRHPQAAAATRALTLSFFAICYVAVTAANALLGQIDGGSLPILALLAAPVVLGTFAGWAIVGRIDDRRLRIVMLGLLALSGIGAVVSALVA